MGFLPFFHKKFPYYCYYDLSSLFLPHTVETKKTDSL